MSSSTDSPQSDATAPSKGSAEEELVELPRSSSSGSTGSQPPRPPGALNRQSSWTTVRNSIGRLKAKARTTWKGSGIQVHTTEAGDIVAKLIQGKKITFRERMFLVMTEPSTGTAAKLVAIATWVIVGSEMIASIIETLSYVNESTGDRPWLYAKIGFNFFFNVESFIRIWSFFPREEAWKDPFTWLDVLTLIPFYVRVGFYPDTLFDATSASLSQAGRPLRMRLLEACQSFRMLKLCRYYEGAQLLNRAVAAAAVQLLVPLFMLLILVYNFSSLLYEIEWEGAIHDCVELWAAEGVARDFLAASPGGVSWGCGEVCGSDNDYTSIVGDDDRRYACQTCMGYPVGHIECNGVPWGQTFHDIPTAIWYNLVTITTVGYGDVYPTTERGRSFAMVVIVCGVVVFLPIPLAIVGNTFTRVWEERQQVKLRGILRQMLTEQGISPTDFTQAFVQFDTDGNGTIEREEFYEIVETHMNLGLSKKDMRAMWRCIDVDGDNSIDIVEFAAVCFPDVDVGLVDEAKAAVEPGAEDEGGGDGKEDTSELKAITNAAHTETMERLEAVEKELQRVASMVESLPGTIMAALAATPGTGLRRRKSCGSILADAVSARDPATPSGASGANGGSGSGKKRRAKSNKVPSGSAATNGTETQTPVLEPPRQTSLNRLRQSMQPGDEHLAC